ncbi:MAG: N-acetyltransferase family protein [Proteobacteria bacterium]|nr:N-acetyltransferase family protein [Pseudomonadota bacterium]
MERGEYCLAPLSAEHGPDVIRLFNHYVEADFSAYFDRPMPEAFFGRLLEMTRDYPAFAALDASGAVVGFAFLHAYHPAPTLARTAEVTYFLAPEHVGRGLGHRLLEALIDGGRKRGCDNFVASISSQNAGSLAFHTRMGFIECGRIARAGTKFGQEFDVVYMQRRLPQE